MYGHFEFVGTHDDWLHATATEVEHTTSKVEVQHTTSKVEP